MRAQLATVGARGTDSVTLISTTQMAKSLRAAGTDFVVQYLGSVTPFIVKNIVDNDLAFMPVTYADRFDGDETVRELYQLNLPHGITVWLDVESVSHLDSELLKLKIDTWATKVDAAGFEPGMYVGPGALLTSEELYKLKVRRYWKSGARIVDRNNHLAEPTCGYCMFQLLPSVTWGSVFSDIDFVQQDFRSRLPTWAVKD